MLIRPVDPALDQLDPSPVPPGLTYLLAASLNSASRKRMSRAGIPLGKADEDRSRRLQSREGDKVDLDKWPTRVKPVYKSRRTVRQASRRNTSRS